VSRGLGSCVGFAVAGGGSRRMGRDKALLPWHGGDLLGHTLARLSAVTPEVRILCGSGRRYLDRGVVVHEDALEGAGPIAGVLAALEAAAGRRALVLAVDLPFVPASLLARLVELGEAFDAVVPASTRGPEPLCACYGPGCRDAIRRRTAAGELKMTGFWPDVRVRVVAPHEIRELADPETAFLNLNAPEDYERARRRDTGH
jgi:molybdopterin-guanine dinucleotide biosynthesis protein A